MGWEGQGMEEKEGGEGGGGREGREHNDIIASGARKGGREGEGVREKVLCKYMVVCAWRGRA